MPTIVIVPGSYDPSTHKIDMAQSAPEDLLPIWEGQLATLNASIANIAGYVPSIQSALNQAASVFAYVQASRHGTNDARGQSLTKRYSEAWAGASALKEAFATLESLCATVDVMIPNPENGTEGYAELLGFGWENPGGEPISG